MTFDGPNPSGRSAGTQPGGLALRTGLRAGLLTMGAALLVYAAWMWQRTRSDPAVAFLSSRKGAEWIRHDGPLSLATHEAGRVTHGFRTVVNVTNLPADAVLEVRAMKFISVLVNGNAIADPLPDARAWKIARRIQLAPVLKPGRNELTILVQNENGPAALWARSAILNVRTDASWESSGDGVTWRRARLAGDRADVPLAGEFESPLHALAARWKIFGVTFALVAAASFFLPRQGQIPPWLSRAANVRWFVLAAWLLLAANNILKLPAAAGFDVSGHLEYIAFVLANHRLPLATDGWQMFQSPLNYVISAPLYRLFVQFAEPSSAGLMLRILPLGCGLLQIELCYRAICRVFPQRNDLQILGTLFGGLLPMNLYLSQYVGNEPLAGVLSAAAFVLSLKLLLASPGDDVRWTPVWLGLIFGLALLAKVTAVLMAVPMSIAISLSSPVQETRFARGLGRAGKTGAVVFGVAAAVAGWYYLRNLIYLGRPFVGGWDIRRGITWWQDPGYRTAADFWSFGTALVRPVCAGVVSFWDGIYATLWSDSYLSSAVAADAVPRWNHGFVAASVFLALVPTAALLLGLVLAVRKVWLRAQPVWLVVLAGVGVFALALIHHALTLPYYCAIKAFYTIGAMPAYALLMVAGCEWITRRRSVRAVFHGLLACWSLAVYVGYLARS